MALMGAGAASSVVGSYFNAKSQKATLAFQADMAEQNAKLAELSAQGELLRGQWAESRQRAQTGRIKSAQRVAMAANGVDLQSQSALEVLTSTDVMGEIDANQIAANAVRAAWGYRMQGSNATSEALVKRAAGEAISPNMAAASSLLSNAGSVATSWYGAKRDAALADAIKNK